MALRKEPHRRYGSARGLAEDLLCFLEDRPITARKDTWGYRTTKFVRRNRAAVAILSATFMLLTAAVAVTSWQAKIARQERVSAQQQQIKSDSVSTFLQTLLSSSNPEVALGEEISLRQVLDDATDRMETELQRSPMIRAELMLTMASAYRNLPVFDESEKLFQEAVSIFRRQGPTAEDRLVRALMAWAELYWDQRSFDRAKVLLREVLTRVERFAPGSSVYAEALVWMARCHSRSQEFTAAEEVLERARIWAADTPADAHPKVKMEVLSAFGEHFLWRGMPDRARPYLQQSYDLCSRLYPANHPMVLNAAANLMVVDEQKAGSAPRTIETYERILEQKQRLYGERNVNLVITLHNLAGELRRAGRVEESEQRVRQAMAISYESFGGPHTTIARSHRSLSLSYRKERDYERAMYHAKLALEVDRQIKPEPTADIQKDMLMIAESARLLGDPSAEAKLLEVLRLRRQYLPPGDSKLAPVLHALGLLYLNQGRAKQGEPWLRESVAIRIAASGPNNPWVAVGQGELGRCLMEQGRQQEAELLLTGALDILTELLGSDHGRTQAVQGYLDQLPAQ